MNICISILTIVRVASRGGSRTVAAVLDPPLASTSKVCTTQSFKQLKQSSDFLVS